MKSPVQRVNTGVIIGNIANIVTPKAPTSLTENKLEESPRTKYTDNMILRMR